MGWGLWELYGRVVVQHMDSLLTIMGYEVEGRRGPQRAGFWSGNLNINCVSVHNRSTAT